MTASPPPNAVPRSKRQTKTKTKTKTWRRRVLFPLLTIGLSLLLAMLVGEIALRLFVDQEAKRLATYDATLGWRGRPHGDGVYIRKIDNIRVPFHYNNLGFRDEDVAAKPSDSRRVLLLGDSFIENLEVEYQQTFPALLEQRLADRAPPSDVVAVGSQGYSTSQELLAFRRYQPLVAADVVLLCFYCGNDYEDNLRRRFAYLDDAGQLQLPINQEPGWKHQARSFQRWLYESSHLVFLLKNGLQSATNINLAPDSKSASDADDNYKQIITETLIAQMDQEVRASGARFGVVVIPFRDDLVASNPERSQQVIEFCEHQAIACLDLSTHLDVEDFFETDIHFNVQGHHKVTQAMDQFVTQSFAPQD